MRRACRWLARRLKALWSWRRPCCPVGQHWTGHDAVVVCRHQRAWILRRPAARVAPPYWARLSKRSAMRYLKEELDRELARFAEVSGR